MEHLHRRNLILIPTACYVEQEMQAEVGKIPPILVPINGKPILDLIIEKYKELPGSSHIYLAAHEGAEQIRLQLNKLPKIEGVRVIDVGKTKDLAETVQVSLSRINLAEFDTLYINFGDSLIDAPLALNKDTIFFDVISESYRWTTFRREAESIEIIDKFQSDFTHESDVFTGLFLFTEPQRFSDALNDTDGEPIIGRFYDAMLRYLHERSFDLTKVTEWVDVGHVDNYFSAKRKFLNKRFFNQIKIDEHSAVLEKRSNHVEKFYGEVKWYLELPSGLKCYIPQVFDYSLCGENSFIRLEYYGYPPLSDMYLLSGHSLSVWNYALEGIFRVVAEMRRYEKSTDQTELFSTFEEMYVTKTLKRVSEIITHPILGPLVNQSLVINGRTFPPLREMLGEISKLVQDNVAVHMPLSVIHGDLCLSNLLYDSKSRIIKLIDPRGKFGRHTIYGDPRYDLAKLSHSFDGFYELIIADSYFTICEGNMIHYSIFVSPRQHELRDMFKGRLALNYPQHLDSIRIIQALLFLSMIPLHGDFLNRQITMLATGIEQLFACIEN